MAFTLPDLPYSHDALEAGGMSRETLEFHHDKHHNAYVAKLNELVAGTEWEGKSLEDIVKGTYQKGAVAQNGIFNNASQQWNHAQCWEMMGPTPGPLPANLEAAIKDSFGSVEEFKKKFAEAGVGQFGSGWVWLVKNADGKLEIHQDRKRRELRCAPVRRRCWAATCGSTATTSTSATRAPSTWRTSWTSW